MFLLCTTGVVADIPLPSASQLEWQNYELGVIIHFDIATSMQYQGCWAGDHYVVPPPSVFNPTLLNTDQWLESAVAFGAKYAVMVVKHSCGFTLWPTNVSFPDFNFVYNYSVKASPFKGDIAASFVASSERYGVRYGFYDTIQVNAYLNAQDGYVINATMSPGQVNVTNEQYRQIVLAQLTELFTTYPNITEFWLDGAYTPEIKDDLEKVLKTYIPNAVVFNGYGVAGNPLRWIGDEAGYAQDPNWSTGCTTNQGDPDSSDWCPSEVDYTLQTGDTWFYDPTVGLRTLSELIHTYHTSVGRNGNMLLDMAITPEGILPPEAVTLYKQLGDFIRNCYGTPLAAVQGNSFSLTLNLPGGTLVDRVVLQEDLSHGQRVRVYSVWGTTRDGEDPVPISSGTSIGNKKIDLLGNAVNLTSLRLSIDGAVATPFIKNFAVYLCE